MNGYWVEFSGENPELARAELGSVAEALGGTLMAPSDAPKEDRGRGVELPSGVAPALLAGRLALARRVLRPVDPGTWTRTKPAPTRVGGRPTAAFRPLGRPESGGTDPHLEVLVAQWKEAGGGIRLVEPDHRFWYAGDRSNPPWVAEEVATVDRRAFRGRRMPRLPFRRPVSLDPRLGRVAANLAQAGPGRTVVDPFLGTGALLAEAALLGATVAGVDRDDVMVRGALENFRALGLEAAALRVADAGAPFDAPGGGRWDALLTDPPYGRASPTGGEEPDDLVRRVVAAWTPHVKPGGRLALVVPAGRRNDLGPDWELREAVPDRVHRSLTREFRLYRRTGPT